ncbi:MAG: HDIG domain-containing protein [Clostridiaceae bacterium]|nr:HDIG domain-containing protein [Clostridiaceae bacterium]
MKRKFNDRVSQKNTNRSQNAFENSNIESRNRGVYLIAVLIVFLITCGLTYLGSQPISYSIQVNDISSYDIDAPRTITNKKETEDLAQEAMAATPIKMKENEEKTALSLANIESFLNLINERRDRLYYGEENNRIIDDVTEETNQVVEDIDPDTETEDTRFRRSPTADEIATAATSMVSQINQNYNIEFELGHANDLLSMNDNRFQHFEENLRTISNLIMSKVLDDEQLENEINENVEQLTEIQNYFASDNVIIKFLLSNLLISNVEYDHEATESAREEAANQIRNNPIKINQGARIVSQGDLITEEIYSVLDELNLTDKNQFDWLSFSGIVLQNLILFVVVYLFFRFYDIDVLLDKQSFWAMIIALLVPLIISFYISKRFPMASTVYFTTIIICSYFGFQASIVLSTVLALMIYPMTSFNSYFLVVTLVGCLTASIFSRKISREDNYVRLIVATTISTVGVVLALNLMREFTASEIIVNVISTIISSMVSVIAAIGVMPIFELLFNTVSPMKIIELSQPGQPLMKRLFAEAPGTSQHSMMVANLADAGCEAIGADTNLVRVGAYYHDIGKLENPLMFTENQEEENPHDQLTPEESVRVITAHTDDGYKLGKKHNLPEPVLKMIQEHHGSTILQYFYHKACQQAELEGREKPEPDEYRYKNPIPSFRESAVLMLADSVEAAMKSSDIDNIEEAEKFLRSIIKIKVEQNQLINSGLSFYDVELIIHAFLQVYTGQFHTRVKYPNQEKKVAEQT